MTIINIIARLTAWAVVHIQNEIQVIGLAPVHHRIDALITVFSTCLSHIILIGEELIVKRQTDGVGALTGDEIDIGLGYVIVLELLPELGGGIRSYSLLEQQVDHPC